MSSERELRRLLQENWSFIDNNTDSGNEIQIALAEEPDFVVLLRKLAEWVVNVRYRRKDEGPFAPHDYLTGLEDAYMRMAVEIERTVQLTPFGWRYMKPDDGWRDPMDDAMKPDCMP